MHTIVCFGDSNTWGCPPYANIAQIADRIPFGRRWAQILQSGLGDGHQVIEEGLGGRTTVFDDPIEGLHKNGSRSLVTVLETHAPIDLLIIMLGTNDFKRQFLNTAFDSSRGILTLVQMAKGHYALADRTPEILLMTPPAITKQAEPAFWGLGPERCVDHAYYLEQVAERTGCFHLDTNRYVAAGLDGVHLDDRAHGILGQALVPEVKRILELRS